MKLASQENVRNIFRALQFSLTMLANGQKYSVSMQQLEYNLEGMAKSYGFDSALNMIELLLAMEQL